VFVSAVANAPAGTAPLVMVAAALHGVAEVFEERRPWSLKRQGVINANPALVEREQAKLARLTDAVAAALRGRGVGEPAASLAAGAGISVFHVTFQAWISPDNSHSFSQIAAESLAVLKVVAAGS